MVVRIGEKARLNSFTDLGNVVVEMNYHQEVKPLLELLKSHVSHAKNEEKKRK